MWARLTAIKEGTALKDREPDDDTMKAMYEKYMEATPPPCPNAETKGCLQEMVLPFVLGKPTAEERWLAKQRKVYIRPPYATVKHTHKCSACEEEFTPPKPARERLKRLSLASVWTDGSMPPCQQCGASAEVIRVLTGKPPFVKPFAVLPSLNKLVMVGRIKLPDSYPPIVKDRSSPFYTKRLTHYCKSCRHYYHHPRPPARKDPVQVYPSPLDVRSVNSPAYDEQPFRGWVTKRAEAAATLPPFPFGKSFASHPYDLSRKAQPPPEPEPEFFATKEAVTDWRQMKPP